MKKWISIALACAVMLGLFAGCGGKETASGSGAAGSTEATYPEYEYTFRDLPEAKYIEAAESFSGGDGSEANPYQISTAPELVLLDKLITEESESGDYKYTYKNASYVLTADIQLNDTANAADWAAQAPEYSWKPIGFDDSFDGVFDGGGHTISGLYISANCDDAYAAHYGLFAGVGGIVKNLNLTDSYIAVSGCSANVGGIAGCQRGDDSLIENCTSNVTIDVYDGSVGGIAGCGSNITGCSFCGTINQVKEGTVSFLGGIVGSYGDVCDCVNYGTINFGAGDVDSVGGIRGYGAGNVTGCENAGTLNCTGAEGDAISDRVGGIVGTAYLFQVDSDCVISDCVNSGTVSGCFHVGGIVGEANPEADYNLIIENCTNTGTVAGEEYLGGIVGVSYAYKGNLQILGCQNTADLYTQAGTAGGIMGMQTCAVLGKQSSTTIRSCVNTGSVTSDDLYAAGILAYWLADDMEMQLTIEDCTNSGTVSSCANAAGILCFTNNTLALEVNENSQGTIRGCVNSGEVIGLSSNTYVGGIAAVLGMENTPMRIDGCTNTGSVKIDFVLSDEEIENMQGSDSFTLTQMAGGIVGRVGRSLMLSSDADKKDASNVNCAGALTVIQDCISTGQISAPDYSFILDDQGQPIFVTNIGGIVGQCSGEDGYSFQVVNCTYSGTDRGLGSTEYPDVGQKK